MAKKKPQSRTDGQSATEKPTNTEGDFVMVPIAREYPPGQVGVLANNLVVQHDGPEFHLLFFQHHPPIISGDTEEEIRKAVQEVEAVKSICVARLIVSAERLPLFIRAMSENLEKRNRQQEEAEAKAERARRGA